MIIPRPQSVRSGTGRFRLDARTLVHADADSPALDLLLARLRTAAGLTPTRSSDVPTNGIVLTTTDVDPSLGPEGYTLDVSPDAVLIRAPDPAGLFYGVQSLLQLLPPQVFAATAQPGVDWAVPAVRIVDRPRFAWRGVMLDVSRHFFTTPEILSLIDELALHKLNVLHWHLTDDQGWRIEIKKYPRLTEVGAWRDAAGFGMAPELSTTYGPDGRYGGFYTQDDVRRIVAYAADRNVTIVPEIELPGHATAALRAYPQFGTPAEPSHELKGDAGIYNAVFEPSNPDTFLFLQDVLDEVLALFPSPHIHIGGDETPKAPWLNHPATRAYMKEHGLVDGEALQSHFIRRIDAHLAERGRRTIGWDEILEGGLAPGATVMSWRGTKGGVAAAQAGHDVVMSPTSHCYLDFEQGLDTEPHERGAVLTTQKAYAYEPMPPELSPEKARHVLGLQGNLWTEYVPNYPWVQYMLWPRAAALAEVAWSPAGGRDWADFAERLAVHEHRLDALGVAYRPLDTDRLTHAIRLTAGRLTIDTPIAGATVRYTLDGTYPMPDSPVYAGPLPMPAGWVHATARYFVPGRTGTPVATAQFLDGHPVTLAATSARDYETRHQNFYTPRFGGRPGDTVTVAFTVGPVPLRGIAVESGTADAPATRVADGQAVLEVSADGKTFIPASEFTGGVARGTLDGSPVAAFRVQFRSMPRPQPVLTNVRLTR